jgi:hypothetical protein
MWWGCQPHAQPQGGPGLHVFDPRRQDDPVIPPGTGYKLYSPFTIRMSYVESIIILRSPQGVSYINKYLLVNNNMNSIWSSRGDGRNIGIREVEAMLPMIFDSELDLPYGSCSWRWLYWWYLPAEYLLTYLCIMHIFFIVVCLKMFLHIKQRLYFPKQR